MTEKAPTQMTDQPILTESERRQIATILGRRANEIAGYKGDVRDKSPASVEYALELEIERLRRLEAKIKPPEPIEEDEQ